MAAWPCLDRPLGLDLVEPQGEHPPPASVGATLRVVRTSNRGLKRFSSERLVWLRADCNTPRWAAARV